MKTTILTKPSPYSRTGYGNRPLLIVHLILAANYLFAIILLLSIPVRHGYGGGITLSLPSFLILFSLLIILHLAGIFQSRLSEQIQFFSGLTLIIAGAMTLGLILFSRQSTNLLQAVYPVPLILSGSLGVSLLIGLFIVTKNGMPRNRDTVVLGPGKNPEFPFPETRYKGVHLIDKGGVGTIWYAERVADGTAVVVKVPIRDDEQTGMSFLQEISLWKELDHPNIVSVLSVNVLPVPYMEMEYLPGSLATLEKPVSIIQARKIIEGLVSALIYAHDRGIAHCDIKPTNILLTNEGVPKLTDWGLSRSASSRWAVSGFSPRYAAPEQSGNNPECSPATDIWQIGMIFAELLTGRAEIPSGNEQVFLQTDGTAILPIILRCLTSEPVHRYSSAQALQDDLYQLPKRIV